MSEHPAILLVEDDNFAAAWPWKPCRPTMSRAMSPAAKPRFVGADLNAQVRFLRKFARSLADWRPLILQQPQTEAWDGLRPEAHRMKSTANAVGALRLAGHCQCIEYAVREGDVVQAARLVDGIDALLVTSAPQLAQRGIDLEIPA